MDFVIIVVDLLSLLYSSDFFLNSKIDFLSSCDLLEGYALHYRPQKAVYANFRQKKNNEDKAKYLSMLPVASFFFE